MNTEFARPKEKSKLFEFAYHPGDWAKDVAAEALTENWGPGYADLKSYITNNFEMAEQNGKVWESSDYALWRVGHLKTAEDEPIWMVYVPNENPNQQQWRYSHVTVGEHPACAEGSAPLEDVCAADYTVPYAPPKYHPEWKTHVDINRWNAYLDAARSRLEQMLDESVLSNRWRLFLTIYGDLQIMSGPNALVVPQWYRGSYGFLVPLSLTSPGVTDLVAALSVDEQHQQYVLQALLLPSEAYAAARSIAEDRQSLGMFVMQQNVPPRDSAWGQEKAVSYRDALPTGAGSRRRTRG